MSHAQHSVYKLLYTTISSPYTATFVKRSIKRRNVNDAPDKPNGNRLNWYWVFPTVNAVFSQSSALIDSCWYPECKSNTVKYRECCRESKISATEETATTRFTQGAQADKNTQRPVARHFYL
ncbi:hypothetical protein CSKR_104596 [Clonorchis sinensis]|uniref:Uncharacterized protein n=1 Tax=Clonorchis sinensis TaxID=79923 RepID=A0A419PLR4_CLOSI|nr:hypothetical protein CSKR_104596 [Clonorchis sinensis]